MVQKRIKLFPKTDRHSLGQKIQDQILEILELSLLAKNKSEKSRILILEKIDIKLQILKFFIRICYDTKIISMKKYLRLEDSILEIGRMLGGWIKASKEKPRE